MNKKFSMVVNRMLRKLRVIFPLVLVFAAFFSACTPFKIVDKIPAGTHRKRILFRSEPTRTEIFLDDRYLGITPIETDIWYIGDRSITVRAQPLYPSQYPQNIVLKVPRVPNKMTIFMDYNPMAAFEMKKKEGGVEGAEDDEEVLAAVEEFDAFSLKDTIIIKEPVPLPIIYYDFDKYFIRESEKPKLYPIIELMQKNPDLLLTIHGHADERGTVVYNKVLSTNRALSVYEFMVDSDIEPNRMRIFGHGELTIVERDGYKLERQNDRVTTFRLHWKEFDEPSMDD